jgi:superfamily II DNA or RNA helicase
MHSNRLDLLLGFFSTSAIRLLSLGFAHFISKGGTMRVVANHILSKEDKDMLIRANAANDDVKVLDLNAVVEIKEALDAYGTHFFECLAWMFANNRIQLKLIKPKDGDGMSHFKDGVFYDDDGNRVRFSASCNFTASGLIRNLENLKVDLGWEDDLSRIKVNTQEAIFKEYYSGESELVEYVPAENVEVAIKKHFGDKDIDQLIQDEVELKQLSIRNVINPRLEKVVDELSEVLDGPDLEPHFPFDEPREYQKTAYQKWVENNRKGLFAMATGTGKTITALNCVLEEYRLNGYYRFLVLVPSLPLASQWKKEATESFSFKDAIVCSSKNRSWEDELRTKAKSIAFGNDTNFCAIATYATFKGKKFQSAFFHLLGDEFVKSVTLIADEAHTMGSAGLLKRLPHQIEKRIGLSATPDRVYDKHGSSHLERFFDAYSPQFTFRYTMKEAIENKVLSQYDYFPVFFDLTENELKVYREYTEKLRRHIDSKTGRYKDNDLVNNLLIQRKNVIHKAKNKLPKLFDIIESIGPEKFKYAFIYVPEGYEPDYEVVDDFDLSKDDKHLINLYTQYLYKNFKFSLKSFTGETKGRDQILELFANGKFDAILAMKCLDEGVDVPRAEYAIFCASTGNPRQFVQRRGRVLRRHKDKPKAIIYDLIAAPLFNKFQIASSQIETEKNIFRSELRRVVNFAAIADNCNEIIQDELASICRNLEIDLNGMLLEELETYE